jgi:hypothetical protein
MRYAVALAVLLMSVTACSSDAGSGSGSGSGSDGPGTATDPAPTDRAEIPDPAVVMDVDRPELCTGPIAESYPPQCSGPPIRYWKWADHRGHFDRVGNVRWGEFVIEGYYEGDEFVVTSAEPA